MRKLVKLTLLFVRNTESFVKRNCADSFAGLRQQENLVAKVGTARWKLEAAPHWLVFH